jgi:two-component system cell cycle response regulator
MTARILIVDDVPANTRLMEAKLSAEYFQVASARDAHEALAITDDWRPDLILLDVMMPGVDGYECCRRLKANPETMHIPVVMVTALGEPEERLRGLEAGADDFLTKPVEYDTLMARVRSLIRLKRLLDEWRTRAATARALGIGDGGREPASVAGATALIIEDWEISGRILRDALRRDGVEAEVVTGGAAALLRIDAMAFDMLAVSLSLADEDPLKLLALLRAHDRTHDTPILLVGDGRDRDRVLRGFELGASDWVIQPVDENELRARARNQIRRKLYQDRLRADLTASLEMALIDPLTGLYNQRYLRRHLDTLIADRDRGDVAVIMVDIDHFKSVNDRFGHAAGDQAIRLLAATLRANTRVFDSVARYGGEEFVIVMPGGDPGEAAVIAERLRHAVEELVFTVPAFGRVPLTVSLGVAFAERAATTTEVLLGAADAALYDAKNAGRNRVRVAGAVAAT